MHAVLSPLKYHTNPSSPKQRVHFGHHRHPTHRCLRFNQGSLYTNADIVISPQRLACISNARIPGVKVGERDAVLAGDGGARVARSDLVELLAVGVHARLEGGGRRDLNMVLSVQRRWKRKKMEKLTPPVVVVVVVRVVVEVGATYPTVLTQTYSSNQRLLQLLPTSGFQV